MPQTVVRFCFPKARGNARSRTEMNLKIVPVGTCTPFFNNVSLINSVPITILGTVYRVAMPRMCVIMLYARQTVPVTALSINTVHIARYNIVETPCNFIITYT